jgi:competence ComEA-like helix-hairpin-helix protein
MSATERRALLLLLSLGLLGHGVRRWLVPSGAPPGQVELLQALPPRSPLPHRDSMLALARPLGPGERIDADRATAAQLARLPRVGMALAKRMVAYREAHGPFGGLPALDGVPGVGPGLLGALAEHLSFSGAPAGGPAGAPAYREGQPGLTGVTPRLAPLSATTTGLLPGPSPGPDRAGRLNLNAANAAALDALPGIGPARAASIVQYRAQHGPFESIDDLGRVPGMGPAAVARVREHLAVP